MIVYSSLSILSSYSLLLIHLFSTIYSAFIIYIFKYNIIIPSVYCHFWINECLWSHYQSNPYYTTTTTTTNVYNSIEHPYSDDYLNISININGCIDLYDCEYSNHYWINHSINDQLIDWNSSDSKPTIKQSSNKLDYWDV